MKKKKTQKDKETLNDFAIVCSFLLNKIYILELMRNIRFIRYLPIYNKRKITRKPDNFKAIICSLGIVNTALTTTAIMLINLYNGGFQSIA